MDGLRDGAAEGESAFACGGVAGDEEEEVGVEDEFVVFPADAGKAGRYDSQGTKEEPVGVFGGFLSGNDLLEEVGKRIRQGVRDGPSLRFLCSLRFFWLSLSLFPFPRPCGLFFRFSDGKIGIFFIFRLPFDRNGVNLLRNNSILL